MKNKIRNLLTGFIFLIPFFSTSHAQDFSKIVPVNAFWLADGDTISTEDALKGISLPSQLEFVMEFDKKKLPPGKQSQRFEMKWARRGATKMYITNSFVRSIDTENPQKTIQASRENLKPGWWMVEVQAYTDRKVVRNKSNGEYWILLQEKTQP